MRLARPTRPDNAERGSAVVEFVMVGVLLVLLLLMVLQLAVYLHVRNVVAASAAEGARHGANADVADPQGEAAARTSQIVTQALGGGMAARLTYDVGFDQAAGAELVRVRVTGAVPSVFAGFGPEIPIDVAGRALREGI